MEPITREEQFMAAAAGQAVEMPEPITRREKFLKAIAERGGGAQPDMAQNDPTQPDYVKNRTHYDSRATEDINITFDGVLDGKEYIELSPGAYLVKVSDLTPSAEEMIGGKAETMWNGASTTSEITEDRISIAPANESLMTVCQFIFVCYEDTEYNGVSITEGVHFLYNPSSNTYATNLSYTGTVGELKKLDEKYLPDSVENRTYWFAGYRDGEEYVLHEGSYAEFMEGFGRGWFTAKVLDESGAIPVIFPISEIYDSSEFGEVLSFQRTYFNRDELKLVCDAIEIADSFAKYTTLYPIGGGAPV